MYFKGLLSLFFRTILIIGLAETSMASDAKGVNKVFKHSEDHKPRGPGHQGGAEEISENQKEISDGVLSEIENSSGLFIVTSESWNNPKGWGILYKKENGVWQKVSEKIPVALGRSGMGWGIGLTDFRKLDGPKKIEGDGRSPAGVFRLPQAFGVSVYGNLPFLEVSGDTICVDDTMSSSYNRIIDANSRTKDWKSFEKMLIPAYELGIEVAHNHELPQRGAGSCIFIHLASPSMSATAGCTAMSKASLELLLSQLDSHSLLLQMPRDELQQLYPNLGD